MIEQDCFKRLTLRAVLRHVSPMVIRLISVSDRMDLPDFNDIFCAVLGWSGNMGYILRIHGQECNSFRRKTRAKSLQEFRLHRQEKFLYVCDTLNRWEWDVQVLDIEDGIERGDTPVCLGGRGATPPEFCGGPTGYRLMLKRQREGSAMLEPKMVEAGIQMLTESSPDTPAGIWNLLHTAVDECLHSLDLRLKESGPLQPDRFSLQEANERLDLLMRQRFRCRA
jgi:Plasmid pRiA4b ORF-3-like protein